MARGNMRMCFFTTRGTQHKSTATIHNGLRQIQLANVIMFVKAAPHSIHTVGLRVITLYTAFSLE